MQRFLRSSAQILVLLLPFASAIAQTNDVLPNATPSELINALTPAVKASAAASASAAPGSAAATDASASVATDTTTDAAAAGEHASVRMRSFKIVKNQPGISKGPAKPVKAASASLMITFETESTRLTGESKHTLDNLAQALNSDKLASFKFTIEGHADSRGSADKNLKLSEERAETVRQYLISQHQIDGSRLIASGKGDTEQLNPGNPAAPENRRVRVLTITE
jgi:outer membrane protein OmpA-like peptidoglycan-associated protein